MNNEANIYRWKNIIPLALYAHKQAEAKGFWEESTTKTTTLCWSSPSWPKQ